MGPTRSPWSAFAAIVAVVLVFVAGTARAEDEPEAKPSYRLVVDRIQHEPASITGTRLSVFLSAQTLQGQRIEITEASSLNTTLGSSELEAPVAIGAFAGTNTATAIVVVVQATLDFQEVLPIITETIDAALLAQLDEQTLFAILPYGDTVGTGKLAPLKTARAKVREIADDGTAGTPALIETVERALVLLKKAKTTPEGRPLRKMILVIGDGRDAAGDRDRVTRVGGRAAKDGVRIHSFAYSPTDQRRPLLLLGELSRKSLGTFRWLQLAKADSWTQKFHQMADEINKQYVLTYFVGPDNDPAGKKLKVAMVGRSVAESLNEVKVPSADCAGEACAGYCTGTRCVIPQEASGRGIVGWLILVGGIGVGAIVVLGLIGFVLAKRQQPIPLPPGVALPPGAVPPPGSIPPPGKKANKPKSQPPAVMPAAPGIIPHLMFMSGPRMGERIPLRHGFMVGNAPGCDIQISDGYTSGHHAQFGLDHLGNCRVFDRGSTNGTFVNGVRVTEQALGHGVTVRIGATDFRFLAQ